MVGADFGELVVLSQEAVAGVDGVGAPRGRRREDVGNIEVALAARCIADADRFVGQLDVQGVAINRAVDGDGGNAQFPAGAQDSKSNFAAVGDQQFADGHPVAVRRIRQGRPVGLYQC